MNKEKEMGKRNEKRETMKRTWQTRKRNEKWGKK